MPRKPKRAVKPRARAGIGAGLVDVRNRTVRGTAYGGASVLALEGLEVFDLYHASPDQTKWLMVVLPGVISAFWNLAENKGWVRPFLKNVPEEPRAAEK